MSFVPKFLCVLLLLYLVDITLSVSTPNRPLGLVYDPDSFEAPVHFDFYIDQQCPDSRRAWPKILQLAQHYGPSKLKLTTHLFPLPYHRNGMRASVCTHAVAGINSSLVYPWIQKVFDNYDDLGNSVNANKSDKQMVDKFINMAVELGVDRAEFISGFTELDATMETVVGWKYACTRGVAETPTFLVNDVLVGYADDASYWSVDDWRRIIDPLVGDDPPVIPPSTTESSPSTATQSVFSPYSVIVAICFFLKIVNL